ncbi:MAG: hypothetical protein E7099_10290 [Mediterranea massiliensis]|nr:hypothetical protein [Mediterranea massiliensis]
MKGKITAIIILTIVALLFTIWCLVDGNYYLALFGLFILGSQIHQLIRNNIASKNGPIQIILLIIVSALSIALMSIGIANKEWLLLGLGLAILIGNSFLLNKFRKGYTK